MTKRFKYFSLIFVICILLFNGSCCTKSTEESIDIISTPIITETPIETPTETPTETEAPVKPYALPLHPALKAYIEQQLKEQETQSNQTQPTAQQIINNDFGDDELYCLTVIVCQEAGWGRKGNVSGTEEYNQDVEQLIRWATATVAINQSIYYNTTIRGICERENNWGTLAKTGVQFTPSVIHGIETETVQTMVLDAYQSAYDVLYGGIHVFDSNVLFAAEFTQGDGPAAILYDSNNVPVYFCYGWYMAPWRD